MKKRGSAGSQTRDCGTEHPGEEACSWSLAQPYGAHLLVRGFLITPMKDGLANQMKPQMRVNVMVNHFRGGLLPN